MTAPLLLVTLVAMSRVCFVSSITYNLYKPPTAQVPTATQIKLLPDAVDKRAACMKKTKFDGPGFPVLRTACALRSGVFRFTLNPVPTEGFALISIYPRLNFNLCRRKFKMTPPRNRSSFELGIDQLSLRMAHLCRKLMGSEFTFRWCRREGECGMKRCLVESDCGRAHSLPRLYGPAKQKVVSLRVWNVQDYGSGGYWPMAKHLYRMLKREVGSANSSECRVKTGCNETKQLCNLKGLKLDPCVRYEFCPYINGSYDPPYSRERCNNPYYWVQATTIIAPDQEVLLASGGMDAYRLSGSDALIRIKMAHNSNYSHRVQIHATICEAPSTNTSICHTKTLAYNPNAHHLIWDNLTSTTEYALSAEACLSCKCTPFKHLTKVPAREWMADMTHLKAQTNGSVVSASFKLSWTSLPHNLTDDLGRVEAVVQCSYGTQQKIYHLPVAMGKAHQHGAWHEHSVVRSAIGNSNKSATTCRAWLSLVIASSSSKNSPPISQTKVVMLAEQPKPQVPTVAMNPDPDNEGVPTGSTNQHQDSTLIVAISLSAAFAVALSASIVAVVRRVRRHQEHDAIDNNFLNRARSQRHLRHKQHRQRRQFHQHPGVICDRGAYNPLGGKNDNDASPNLPLKCSCLVCRNPDYERLNSEHLPTPALRPPGCSQRGRAPAAPPVPNTPRPVHILCHSQNMSRVTTKLLESDDEYDRLFAH